MAEENGKGKAAKLVEVVQMKDGRSVEFAGKRKLLKEDVQVDGRVGVRLDFRNGETRTFVIPDELKNKFAAHGAKQKYGDEAAGMTDIDDIVLAIDELNETIQSGKWREEREGGGFAGTSVLLRALVEYSGKTVEEVKGFLQGKTQAEKMGLRNSKKIKPIVDRIEAEKLAASSKVDIGQLEADLDAFA